MIADTPLPLAGPGPQPEGAALLQQRELSYYQAWLCSTAQAPLQAVALESVQAAVRVVVSGFSDTTSAEELRNVFEGLIAAHHAAVAPGKAVKSCNIQPGTPSSAVLQLRCAAEASNCLAFDSLVWNGAVLKVGRPQDYNPEVAVLLGPTEPNPIVAAAVAGSSTAARTAAADAAGNSFAAAVRSAAAGHRASAPGGAGSCSKAGARDLLLPADQSKQDEVFIGGLPSNWKAQQLKELLAPYGQLKSLSVAMDASTGKNKGYAFVVFASPDMVSHAIEELDCRVVEGKILAVQRATEGKACYGRDSSGGGNDTGSLRDGGFVGPQHQPPHQHQPLPLPGPGPQQQQQQAPHQQQQHQQQHQQPPLHQHAPPLLRHHHHRSSSTGSALPPHLPAPVVAADVGAACAAVPATAGGPPAPFAAHNRGSSAVAPAGPSSLGPAPPPAAAAAADSSVLMGPRPPPAGLPGGAMGSSMQHHSGPSSAKQYDINELYIGDLPLTWDEDAVRRLLGRFGRIKYFTLRNGRDKNFAFCKFKDSSVVDAAIAGLHGKIVDGYFLNVRRAIEGKQQQGAVPGASPQAQPSWLAGGKPALHQAHHQHQHPQQQQQQPNVRASFDAASSTRAAALPTHRPRMSADQQQLSKLAAAATAAGPPLAPTGVGSTAGGKGPGGLLGHPFSGPLGARSNVLATGGAAGGRMEAQQQRGMGQDGVRGQMSAQERARAGSPPAVGGAAGAANSPAQQPEVGSGGGGSTAPSTPGTPTVEQPAGAAPPEQQQQQKPAAGASAVTTALPPSVSGPGLPARGYGPFTGPQLLQRPGLPLPGHHHQQQQQAQAHLQQQQQLQQQLQQQQQQNAYQAQVSGYGASAGLAGTAPLFPPGPLPPPAQPGGGASAASLFGPNGPASWPGTASLATALAAAAAASPASVAAGNLALPVASGGAFSMGMGLKQQQQQEAAAVPAIQQGPATQAQSLLQTWDMLSPWSLFSHTAQ